jgi:hypothetical protein
MLIDSADKSYRVRTRNARRQSMHAHHQNGLHKIEAVESHTKVFITRQLSRVHTCMCKGKDALTTVATVSVHMFGIAC